jgi:hypothetical protein
MSTVPLVRAIDIHAEPSVCYLDFPARDQETLGWANEDDCVVNRLGGARGVMAGITGGALLWVGLIWAGVALIK